MCLAAFAVGVCDAFPLVVAANRDESHQRPTAAADWWSEPEGILGGRDLEAGGSWLAVDRLGRLAAITNLPSPRGQTFPGSRGSLVSDFLATPLAADAFCQERAGAPEKYGPYNLLLYDGERLFHSANGTGALRLEAGIHVLSNAPLGTSWPKVDLAAAGVAAILEQESDHTRLVGRLFELLETPGPQKTGADGTEPHWRRHAVFVRHPHYGTRSSTVVLWSRDGNLYLVERRFDADGRRQGESAFSFSPASASGPQASR